MTLAEWTAMSVGPRHVPNVNPEFLIECARLKAQAEAFESSDGQATLETSCGPLTLDVRPSYAYAHFGEWGDEPSANGPREHRALCFDKKWRES